MGYRRAERTRRHAQRDLDSLHRRLRRPHRRTHRAPGSANASQGPRRRRVCVPASVRLLAARWRSGSHAQAHRLARPHPNAGGVLILGLGCESNQLEQLLAGDSAGERAHIRTFAAQATQDETEEGLRARRRARADRRARSSASRARCRRSTIGLKCGGSDGFSGMTANPLVGRIDRSRHRRGRHGDPDRNPGDLRRRALAHGARGDARGVRRGSARLVNDFKRYFLENDQPVHENPSPGNIAGGITTLEEKSLGAVQKGGHATVTQVLRYGERIERARPRVAGSARQRRRLFDRARCGRRDDRAVHDRPRHAARLSGADAEDQLELGARRRPSRTGSISTPAACSTGDPQRAGRRLLRLIVASASGRRRATSSTKNARSRSGKMA